jgi:hypothetical protein
VYKKPISSFSNAEDLALIRSLSTNNLKDPGFSAQATKNLNIIKKYDNYLYDQILILINGVPSISNVNSLY